jgi:hypothetical protein
MPRKNSIDPDDLDLQEAAPADGLDKEALQAAQAAAQAVGTIGLKAEPKVWVSDRLQRCVCIRECFHTIKTPKGIAGRVYKPGQEYVAQKGELVPRHFLPRNSPDPRVAEAKAGGSPEQKVPPFIANARKIVNG